MDIEEPTPVTYTYADFLAAQRLHATPRRRDALIIALCIAIFDLFMIWLNDDMSATLIGLASGLILSLATWWFILIPFTARRNFARLPPAERTFHFALTSRGVLQRSTRGQSTLSWAEMIFWRQNRQTILLYTSPRHFLLIPKRIDSMQLAMRDLQESLTRELGVARR